MAKKQKFLRNLLTSVSVASIIASIGGSSVAFADNAKVGAGGVSNLSDIWAARGIKEDATDWVEFDVPRGQLIVNDDPATPKKINGIDVNNVTAGPTRIEKDISIGNILDGGAAAGGRPINLMPVALADGMTLTLVGDLDPTKNDYTALGAIDFGRAGRSTLTFNHDGDVTFASAIVNGNNGTLNVQGDLTATNADIGKINVINIGTAAAGGADPKPGTLSINASAADVALLDATAAGARAAITFLDKKSKLKLYIDDTAGADRTITFHKDLPGMAGGDGGGIVVLQGTNANTLVVQSKGGTKFLGTGAAKLDELQVRGNVTIRGVNKAISDAAAKAGIPAPDINMINVRYAKKLNVINGATFIDESLTSRLIPKIHIGADGGDGAGRANYILDTQLYDFIILSNGNKIAFEHEDAQLTLRNSGNVDSFITFKGNLEGRMGPNGGGVVLLESINPNKALTVRSNDGLRTLGTKEKKLKELQVRGNVIIGGMDDAAAAVAVAERAAAGSATRRLDVSNAKKLNVIKGALFIDQSTTSAQIAEIHIGADDGIRGGGKGKANYVLDAIYRNFGILATNDGGENKIIFDAADAQLTLRNSSAANNRTITFNNNLAGFNSAVAPVVDHGGIVSLESTKNKTLIVQSLDGTQTLGTDEHKIGELQVRGNVIIAGMDEAAAKAAEEARLAVAVVVGDPIVANRLDVSNVNALNIMNGATFLDQSATSAKIAKIHIGADAGAGVGAATYVLDAVYGNFDILNGSVITFDDAGSRLTLQNSSDAKDRTITFHNDLAGFSDGAGVDHGGIVSLEGINGKTLFVQSAGGIKTLGTAGAKLDELQVRGKVTALGTDTKNLGFSNVNVLNVMKGAVFTDESATSAQIGAINIGADGGGLPAVAGVGQANYIIETRYKAGVEILNGKTITFKAADAQLTLRNSSTRTNRTITFHNNLAGFSDGAGVDHGGIVSLESENGRTLFVQSSDGTKTLGTSGLGGYNIGKLQVRGKVIILGDNTDPDPADRTKLNVSNAKMLNVIKGAVFTDESATSAQIAKINIGADGGDPPPAGGVGPADYILDAKYGDFTILANPGDQINFLHADANLILRNSADVDRIITLTNTLDPGDGVDPVIGKNVGKGIVQLQSIRAGKILTIEAGVGGGGVQSLGTNGNNIKEIIITGGGQVVIEPTIYAKTITLNVARLTTQNVVNGKIEFSRNTAFIANNNIVGDINFLDKAGIITLANNKTITGKVEGNNAGTLNFAENGIVIGDIGEDSKPGKPLNIISLSVGDVTLQGNVFTNNLNYYSSIGADGMPVAPAVDADGRTVTIGGNFKGKVDFNAAHENILTFNGATVDATGNPKSYIFDSEIANGDNGILNVQTNLVTNADVGKIKIINIGTPAVVAPPAPILPNTLAISASAGNVNLLTHVDAKINFLHPNSKLELFTSGARNDHSIIFKNDLPGAAAVPGAPGVPGGIVFMSGVRGATLTVEANGNRFLGTAGAKLGHIAAFGQVIIARGVAGTLDISNTGKLSIVHDPANDTIFTDESGTSAAIARIDIGQSYHGAGAIGGTDLGKAIYVLDTKHVDFDILTGTNQINFLDEAAQLTLQNSSGARNGEITLARDLDPGPGGVNGKGIVEFNSVDANKILTINKVGNASLGTAANSLKEIIFSGDGDFTIHPAIHAKNIKLDAAIMYLGVVNSHVRFARSTRFNVTNIAGDVDFANQAGTIRLTNNGRIAGSVTSTGGVNGTLVFIENGSVGGLITNLGMLRAGNGNVTLIAGNHSITEIQGNGEQNLTFVGGFNLEGGINLTPGGQAVGLIFSGDGSISGGVGTNSTVGDIQIQAGTVAFGSSIKAKDINISAGATAEIVEDTIAKNIKGGGKVKFNNTTDMILNAPISIDTMEIAGTNVKITEEVLGSNIHFSGSDPVTLTLNAVSTVNNIETAGNEVHSMALDADFTTTGDIGSESNRLKEIKLLGDHTFSIKGNKIYSPILTTTDNSGKVIFLDDSVAYGNLGEEKVRLADVTFDSNSKVEADVYSKKITINADKEASFAGTNTRTISIPGIPRLLKEFTYSTEIVSEEINAEGSSKMIFDNAALINAPINGGQVILADNVWFKEEVKSAASATFAPGKYVILEKNIAFSNIEASQATIIILSEKQAITGELAAKNLTIDLGANQLKYAGNAKLTGELKLHSFYDSSKSVGGNIEIQSNSKLDLSQLDKLAIVIVGRSNINKISDAPQHVLISSVGGNGISALDPNKITLDSSGEQNRFVRWTIDYSSLTLDAQESSPQDENGVSPEDKKLAFLREDASKEFLDKEFADGPEEKKHFVNQLEEAKKKDPNCDAANVMDELGNMEEDDTKRAVERLFSSNENPIGESIAKDLIVFNIIETMVIDIASQITSRSMNMQLPANMQVPVGAGDDDKMMYGVWGSPFYSIANQKMRKGVSGYKSKSAGGIVGFDSLINDDLLVGAAYSRIDTKMSHKNQKIGDKTSGKTNVFSVYGLYKFPANWFAEAIVSYGITNVKNLEGRVKPTDVRKITILDTVVAKYKSTSYNGQLLAGYSYQPSEKLVITPTIGFRYSQFTDSGYTETGTAYQKLIVKKRSYNKFEGILGLRTATNIKLDQMLLIPELHGYVNYDFKGKTPVIDARLGGMDEPLPIKSVKPSKVSFTVGTGLTVKSNMMEYGVTYNAHIANKYIGHQGSLKVKVNF